MSAGDFFLHFLTLHFDNKIIQHLVINPKVNMTSLEERISVTANTEVEHVLTITVTDLN